MSVAAPNSAAAALRPARARRILPALLAGSVGLIAALVFLPHLRAGFVSDAFGFLGRARGATLGSLAALFIPSATTWYRPVTGLVFWIEYRLFGLDPIGYHAVALACHVASSVLIFRLSRRVARSDLGASLAAGAFLFSVHAHEVVFDIADLHNALSGVALLACVLAYARGARGVSLGLGALTMTIDETGLLALPLVGLWEAAFAVRSAGRRPIIAAAIRLAPFAALTAGYLAFRMLVGGAIAGEGPPCRTVTCLAVAAAEYLNRLFVRPDSLLSGIWTRRFSLAAATLVTVAVALALVRPWTWRTWRPALYGAAWVAGTTLFFILALFPYVTDRFVYVPDMGLALLLAAAAAESRRRWPAASRAARAGAALVGLAVILWIAAGASMLAHRGQLWDRAGARARSIVESTAALVPDPPPNALFVFREVPDSDTPDVPPGNTGPYLFRNGLRAALRIRYGRTDLEVKRGPDGPPGAILLVIDGGRVRRVAPPE